MSWATTPDLLADLVIPTSVVMILVPLLAAVGVGFLVMRMDRIAQSVFPHLAWEHSLGWFNMKAQRRANAAFRWIRRGLYLLLFDSLVLMPWTARDFPSLQGPATDWNWIEVVWRVSLILLCIAIWVLYLGCSLLPHIRARKEKKALHRFRVEMEEQEQERGEYIPKSRVHTSLAQPIGPNRRRFNQPGG